CARGGAFGNYDYLEFW
nr:immunoglobulin heavy chain junction region [Macaca mulatta]